MKPTLNISIIHGPNLQMLGTREPERYGTATLIEINNKLLEKAHQRHIEIDFFQSNCEGEIVSYIGTDRTCDGIIINPAAYTHTSIAIRDALLAKKIPFIEVHLSNIFSREPFRHHSYFSDIAIGTITGFGQNSYFLGLEALILFLRNS